MESTKPDADQQGSAAISRYQIQEELGRGAMGAVHKAFDPVIGRTVALKTILIDDHAPDRTQVIERLKQEAKAAGGLDHPNIITIYDIGEENGTVYLSMQFVQGITLAKLLAEVGVPSLPTLLSWADQTLAAVGFAHARGVIHRDLKPANLMVTEQGTIKVLDYGIAKIESTSLTQTGLVIGTPAYMAPEQIAGKKSDYRADIFSLGAVFYELLTREKAFPGDIVTALYKIVNEDPIVPSLINPAIPGWIDLVIRKALAKDPKDRFQSCEEMRQAFLAQSVPAPDAAPTTVPGARAGANRPQVPASARNISRRHEAPRRILSRLILALSLFLIAAASWTYYVRSSTGVFPPLVTSLLSQGEQNLTLATDKFSKYASQAFHGDNEPGVPALRPQNSVTTDTPDKTQTVEPVESGAPPVGNSKPSPAVSNDHPESAPAPAPGVPTTSSQQAVDPSQSPSLKTTSAQTASPEVVQSSDNNQPAGDKTSQESTAPPVASRDNQEPSASASRWPNQKRVSEPPPMVDGYTRQDVPDLLRQANIYEDRGEYRLARYQYRLILRLDPNNSKAQEALHRLLFLWQKR